MHDADGVRGGQGLRDRQTDRDDLTGVQVPAGGEQPREADTADDRLGDQRQALRGRQHRHDRHQMGMLQVHEGPGRDNRRGTQHWVRRQPHPPHHALDPGLVELTRPELSRAGVPQAGTHAHPRDLGYAADAPGRSVRGIVGEGHKKRR